MALVSVLAASSRGPRWHEGGAGPLVLAGGGGGCGPSSATSRAGASPRWPPSGCRRQC